MRDVQALGIQIDSQLRHLVDRAWLQFNSFKRSTDHVVGSCPILYFGNRRKYLNSDCRIITVGLNPSRLEFENSNPHVLFKGQASDYSGYLKALDGYFERDPYEKWFNMGYEHLLNGLGGGYYGDQPNTVLHTDLCSTIATTPTWSSLAKKYPKLCDALQSEGVKLWRLLTRYLNPDLIIISIQKALVEKEIAPEGEWKTIYTLPRRRPYEIKTCLWEGRRVVFGLAANTPFGKISYEAKEKIGRFLKHYYRLGLSARGQ